MNDAPARALEIDGVSARYGRAVAALHDVSLHVAAGEVVTLMGLNGAGKTTIARAVTGLLAHNRGSVTAGAIRSFGADLTRRSPRFIVRHGVAQALEGRRVFAGMTVRENLDAGGTTVGPVALRAARERVYAMFPRLAERADQHAGLLSGGEQQMLALGRALMTSPRLLVLDEPTLGLSPKLAASVRDTIRDIQAAGASVLLIEQNAAIALSVADRGYVIEHGRIVHEGTAAALRDDPDLTRLLLGLSREDAA